MQKTAPWQPSFVFLLLRHRVTLANVAQVQSNTRARQPPRGAHRGMAEQSTGSTQQSCGAPSVRRFSAGLRRGRRNHLAALDHAPNNLLAAILKRVPLEDR